MKFEGQMFEVARYRARDRVGANDVGSAEWDPASGAADEMNAWPSLLTGRGVPGGSCAAVGQKWQRNDSCSELSQVFWGGR